MVYNVETHFGCTASNISVNNLSYDKDDYNPQYSLTDEDRLRFVDALFKTLREMFDDGVIPLYMILEDHFVPDREERSETCDTCGDSVCSRYYSFEAPE